MGLQHDNPNTLPQDAPRTQRLTADESRAVIALWQQERVEQTGLSDRPALPDVAEGLDIPVEEVQRLLAEVRAQRLEEEAELARERKLAKAMRRLAEEEAKLAEVQHQRTEARLTKAERRERSAEDEAVPWEVWKATHAPMQEVETWKDKKAPATYRAGLGKRTSFVYALYSVLLLAVACLGWLLLSFLANLFMLNTR